MTDEGRNLEHPVSPADPASAGPSRPGRGTVRFLWHADAEGRFTSISETLAEIVGRSADVLGRRWEEIVGRVVEDPSGTVSQAFAAGETWTGRVVEWRIADTDFVVPVDLAGMPVRNRDGRLAGFRGFGLCRTDELSERPLFVDRDAASDAVQEPAQVELASSDGRFPDAVEPESADFQEDAADEVTGSETPSDRERADEEPSCTAAGTELAEATEGADHSPAAAANEQVDARVAGPAISFADIRGAVAARLGDPRIPLRVADEPAPAAPSNEHEEASAHAPPSRTAPRLSVSERSAFREIARALGARFDDDEPSEAESLREDRSVVTPLRPAPAVDAQTERILDRLPVGILIHRGDEPLFANRLLLDLVDYDDIGQLAAAGGVPRLFRSRIGPLARFNESAPLALTTRMNESVAVEVRLTTVEWDGLPASLMLVRKALEAEQGQRLRALELELRVREARLHELSSILDTATDGVLVLDDEGRILSLNRSAEALFGYDQNEVVGERFIVLLAPESHAVALDYLEGLRGNGVASLLNDGREVFGRVRQGGAIPLFMTVGRISEGPERKFCAVLRDITPFKKAEGELLSAKRAAEEGSAQKSDFLAKVSHEIRTPLNAIIGFAQVMLEERFGPIGNERYKDYLRDIHTSGGHVISLVNDLLDLAKVEAGRMELAFTSVKLNDVVAACVTLMQPQAARERIVMRTSFAQKLPSVVADERSMRQIVLNIIANAIRFTEAGGQVIVSTALTDRGEVGIRVRDTGLGMSAEDVAAALEPFRQLATTRRGGGTGLGLPLTKALVEANRGTLRITSARNEGTLVEVLFPPTRVLAE
jgi:PAS domain S-box-containing protein